MKEDADWIGSSEDGLVEAFKINRGDKCVRAVVVVNNEVCKNVRLLVCATLTGFRVLDDGEDIDTEML